MPICKLCNEEADTIYHSIKHFVMEFIQKQNPTWVEEDGSCKKCLVHYESFDENIEIIE